MSEQTSQEPTMEEILASIRRIISEDDAPADAEAPAAAEAPEPEPVAAAPEPVAAAEPEPEPEPEPILTEAAAEEDDALELTERVESETHGDLEVYTPEPAPPPAPVAAAPAPVMAEALVSSAAATAAASAFSSLSAAIAMPKGDRTLEDVVRELLQPLLKGWLDENLPRIVEAAVQEEVERIARGRVR
jgi:cell pole-organizing protein PopZ